MIISILKNASLNQQQKYKTNRQVKIASFYFAVSEVTSKSNLIIHFRGDTDAGSTKTA